MKPTTFESAEPQLSDGDTDYLLYDDVLLRDAQPFETVFPEPMVHFLTDVNFTNTAEEVFDLIVEAGKSVGFDLVMYEYCHDVLAEDSELTVRTNAPAALAKLESMLRPKRVERVSYGRRHCTEKWTPGVSGAEFVDMFPQHPEYQRKMRLARIVPGVRSGFAVPLRSQNPATRAGLGFAGQMSRNECIETIRQHGPMLTTIAWAGHTRILQHSRGESGSTDQRLTERQARYVELLAAGLLDKQIAYEMNVSHSGVRKFQSAVMRKLEVTRRNDIVPRALRLGLITSDQIEPAAKPRTIWNVLSWRGGPKEQDAETEVLGSIDKPVSETKR